MAATAALPSELAPRTLRRRGAQLALAAAVLALVVVLAPGLGDVRDAFTRASPGWLGVALALEALSCAAYALMFRPIFCRRMSLGRSWQIAWSELAVGSVVPASGASGLALGAWVLRQGGMTRERIARRSVAFFLIKSSVNFVAVAVLGALLATGVLGPNLSPWLTALPAALSLVLVAVVVALPRLGPGADPPAGAGRVRRGATAARRAVIAGIGEAAEIVRSRDLAVLAGAAGYWAFDNAVLYATFRALGETPELSIVLLGYLIGQLGGLLPIPGGIGGIDGGLIGTLVVFGLPLATTAAAVLLYRVILFWLPLVIGGATFLGLRRAIARPGGLRLTPAGSAAC